MLLLSATLANLFSSNPISNWTSISYSKQLNENMLELTNTFVCYIIIITSI